MQGVTVPQIQKIHVLLNSLGLIEQKKYIIYQLTDGRAQSTTQLTCDEARRLITSLAGYDPTERLKRIIFSLAYQAGIIYGDTPEDKKMNAAKLDTFLKERGAVKKALNEMFYPELVKVHRQFEAIVKNTANAAANKAAIGAVSNLLAEFNIPVQNGTRNQKNRI